MIDNSVSMMKAFVNGVGGQLGYEIMNQLRNCGFDRVGSDIMKKSDDDYVQLDITDKDAVDRALTEIRPDAVIHCAAWTAVDAAEEAENREKEGFCHQCRWNKKSC